MIVGKRREAAAPVRAQPCLTPGKRPQGAQPGERVTLETAPVGRY